jgi:beta-fructofuranosidase
MSVLPRDGRFYMLYTALCRAEAGRVQRVGLAVSDDLETWVKEPGPIIEAAAPHYRTDRDGAPWVAWRDPKPVVLADEL